MSNLTQTMTLDENGCLLTSCDSLFPTTALATENMKQVFPFLESVFLVLMSNLELGRVISFPKIETKHAFLSGYYDYSFKLIRVKNNGWGIQWEVTDATEKYSALKKQQQSDHEEDIQTQ